LKIEKTIAENHEAKLVVEIEPEKMEEYKRRAARKISQRGKIAGFRPGKAPYHMVVLNYGEQAIVEQAIGEIDGQFIHPQGGVWPVVVTQGHVSIQLRDVVEIGQPTHLCFLKDRILHQYRLANKRQGGTGLCTRSVDPQQR